MNKKIPHDFDEDSVCRLCGFDGAENWWLNKNLRMEIGDDEFQYRIETGELDDGRFCKKRWIRR